jgi:hypothetical protein
MNLVLGALNEEINKYNNLKNETLQTIEELKQKNPKPFPRTQYEENFGLIERRGRIYNHLFSQIQEIKNKTDILKLKINDNMEADMEFKKTFNNHQFRSGIQGLSKQVIKNNNLEYPELLEEMVEAENVDTPYNKKGGKKTRMRKTRMRKTKRRKA